MYKTNKANVKLRRSHTYNSITTFIDLLSYLFASSRDRYILKQRAFVWSLPSNNRSQEESSELAQLYHFDLDSLSWQKFFIYLNDVTQANGPHEYVSKTHHVEAKSDVLLRMGYARHTRDTIRQSLKDGQQERQVMGQAGTIFLGDTKCWHRGTEPSSSHRFLMSNVYCSHPVSMELTG